MKRPLQPVLLAVLAVALWGCGTGSLEPFSGTFTATLEGPEGALTFEGRAISLRSVVDGVYTVGLLEGSTALPGFTGRTVTLEWRTVEVRRGSYPVTDDAGEGTVTVVMQAIPGDPFEFAVGASGTVDVTHVDRLASRGTFEIALRTDADEGGAGAYALRGTFEAAPFGL